MHTKLSEPPPLPSKQDIFVTIRSVFPCYGLANEPYRSAGPIRGTDMKPQPEQTRIIVFVVLVLIFGLIVGKQLEIDTCLDHGGRWDYDIGNCEGQQ